MRDSRSARHCRRTVAGVAVAALAIVGAVASSATAEGTVDQSDPGRAPGPSPVSQAAWQAAQRFNPAPTTRRGLGGETRGRAPNRCRIPILKGSIVIQDSAKDLAAGWAQALRHAVAVKRAGHVLGEDLPR